MASTTLLLPEPLGPTTQVIPGAKSKRVRSAKLLKPKRSSDLSIEVPQRMMKHGRNTDFAPRFVKSVFDPCLIRGSLSFWVRIDITQVAAPLSCVGTGPGTHPNGRKIW